MKSTSGITFFMPFCLSNTFAPIEKSAKLIKSTLLELFEHSEVETKASPVQDSLFGLTK